MNISRKYSHQILACVPAVLIQFLTGVGWGWTAPTLLRLQSGDSDFTLTTSQASWLGSVGEIGRMCSTLLSALLLDNFGRKSTFILGSAIYFIVWSFVFYTRNEYVLLASRALFGIGNGLNDVTSTIYPVETCSPEFRGTIVGATVLALLAGMTFGSSVSTYTTYTNAAIVNAVLTLVAIGSTYFFVETPYFLTIKGKHERAKKNFAWLQQVDHRDIEGELQKIRKNVDEEKRKKKSLKALFASTANLKALFAATGFSLLFATIGIQTVVPYASMIFVSSEAFEANEYTIMFDAVKFLGTTVSLFFVERIDRRPLIIYSLAIITSCHVCTSGLTFLRGANYDVSFYPWLLFSCLALFGFVSCFMMTAVLTAYSEILPLSVRAIGGGLTTTVASLGTFVTTLLFWPITNSFGMGTNFCIYTITSSLTIIFVYTVLPETRGKSLHEMQENANQRDVHDSV